jgi:chromosome segregation ATPase
METYLQDLEKTLAPISKQAEKHLSHLENLEENLKKLTENENYNLRPQLQSVKGQQKLLEGKIEQAREQKRMFQSELSRKTYLGINYSRISFKKSYASRSRNSRKKHTGIYVSIHNFKKKILFFIFFRPRQRMGQKFGRVVWRVKR